MKITQVFSLNPLEWLIQWNLRSILPLSIPINIPPITYEEEFWFKSPEVTLKTQKANCINKSLLLFYNYSISLSKNENVCGIFYFPVANGMHAEFGFVNEDKMEIRIVEDMNTSKILLPGEYAFITTSKIQKISI